MKVIVLTTRRDTSLWNTSRECCPKQSLRRPGHSGFLLSASMCAHGHGLVPTVVVRHLLEVKSSSSQGMFHDTAAQGASVWPERRLCAGMLWPMTVPTASLVRGSE